MLGNAGLGSIEPGTYLRYCLLSGFEKINDPQSDWMSNRFKDIGGLPENFGIRIGYRVRKGFFNHQCPARFKSCGIQEILYSVIYIY
jgi:hypothetical protein